jgi:hypothetical protein
MERYSHGALAGLHCRCGLVGTTGFEAATPRSQSERSPNPSYTPWPHYL